MIRCLALFLLASLHVGCCLAWTTGSSVSSFGGGVLITDSGCSKSSSCRQSHLTMKKGKANVPPQMRSQYKRQQELAQMQKQMINAQKAGADGLPVFNLFVRTKRANVRAEKRRPVSVFASDDRSDKLRSSLLVFFAQTQF